MALYKLVSTSLSAAPHQRRLAAGIDTEHYQLSGCDGSQRRRKLCLTTKGATCCLQWFTISSGAHTVGYAARDNAAQDTANTISSVKRMMGRSLADIGRAIRICLTGLGKSVNGLPMIDTAAGLLNRYAYRLIFSKLWPRGHSESLSGELDGVVITVPPISMMPNVRDERRRAAGRPACTAPAQQRTDGSGIAYGLDSGKGVIAVYDLGGGTASISLFTPERGIV